jgi:2-hydroxy-3-keto-5-methylthiopentenyl-1-phosphate phosphatase
MVYPTLVSSNHEIKFIVAIDTGLLLIDDHRSMGPERRRVLEHEILEGTRTYRDCLAEMWSSVHISWDEAWAEYLDSTYIHIYISIYMYKLINSSCFIVHRLYY